MLKLYHENKKTCRAICDGFSGQQTWQELEVEQGRVGLWGSLPAAQCAADMAGTERWNADEQVTASGARTHPELTSASLMHAASAAPPPERWAPLTAPFTAAASAASSFWATFCTQSTLPLHVGLSSRTLSHASHARQALAGQRVIAVPWHVSSMSWLTLTLAGHKRLLRMARTSTRAAVRRARERRAHLELRVQLRVQRRGEQVVQLPQHRAHALRVRGGQGAPTALHPHMRASDSRRPKST